MVVLEWMLGFELDVFYREVSGIFQQPISVVPQTFGYTLPPLNAGVNSNRGFDIMLTHKNRINDDLSYNVNAMFSWNRGRYDKNITDQLFDISTLDPDDYASEDDYKLRLISMNKVIS